MKNPFRTAFFTGALLSLLASCSPQPQTTLSGLNPAAFDSVIGGREVHLYTLTNAAGAEVCITNFGGRVVSLLVPDRDGRPTDVVLGYDNLAQYADAEHSGSDFGASIGRYANRINLGRFVAGGDTVQLPQNNYGHCLHGGPTGWQYQVYDVTSHTDSTLSLSLVSPDGDNGFPGEVKASVSFLLTADNTLDIRFSATTDRETVVNMTNHSYFNLSGDPSQPATDHLLFINASRFTPSDSTFMTTGEVLPVAGTPMDFTEPRPLADHIDDASFEQIRNARGYDHNFCLDTYADGSGDDTQPCASLYCPRTGILLEMFTDEPGVQVYTGNFLGNGPVCKNGITYPQHASICLESQKYPDSPNKPQFPSPYLRPGETYTSHVAYRFSHGE